APPARWWMVVGEAHAQACRSAVPEVPAPQTLEEPIGRNTAPAIGLAAIHLERRANDTVMVVLPADHHVGNPAALAAALVTAVELEEAGAIVTLGVVPRYAETGYGYIERGAPTGHGAFGVHCFVEKPNRARAGELLTIGDAH